MSFINIYRNYFIKYNLYFIKIKISLETKNFFRKMDISLEKTEISLEIIIINHILIKILYKIFLLVTVIKYHNFNKILCIYI